MQVVNIAEKFAQFQEHWSPRIAGTLNGQEIKLAKLKGEFIWHHHENEDEMFFVIQGNLKIEFRDRSITIKPNEFVIVPRGIEHKPIAEEEVWVMLFEPAGTLNTGNVNSERTRENPDTI